MRRPPDRWVAKGDGGNTLSRPLIHPSESQHPKSTPKSSVIAGNTEPWVRVRHCLVCHTGASPSWNPELPLKMSHFSHFGPCNFFGAFLIRLEPLGGSAAQLVHATVGAIKNELGQSKISYIENSNTYHNNITHYTQSKMLGRARLHNRTSVLAVIIGRWQR